MNRLIGRLVKIGWLIGFVAIGAIPSTAQAGCYCQCVDGAFRATCSGQFDIAPICPARSCSTNIRQTPRRIGDGGQSQCAPVRDCDIYGHCQWKTSCDK